MVGCIPTRFQNDVNQIVELKSIIALSVGDSGGKVTCFILALGPFEDKLNPRATRIHVEKNRIENLKDHNEFPDKTTPVKSATCARATKSNNLLIFRGKFLARIERKMTPQKERIMGRAHRPDGFRTREQA